MSQTDTLGKWYHLKTSVWYRRKCTIDVDSNITLQKVSSVHQKTGLPPHLTSEFSKGLFSPKGFDVCAHLAYIGHSLSPYLCTCILPLSNEEVKLFSAKCSFPALPRQDLCPGRELQECLWLLFPLISPFFLSFSNEVSVFLTPNLWDEQKSWAELRIRAFKTLLTSI